MKNLAEEENQSKESKKSKDVREGINENSRTSIKTVDDIGG